VRRAFFWLCAAALVALFFERLLVWYGTLYYSDVEPPRFCEIVRLPTFERSSRGLLSDDDQRELDTVLAANPRAGVVIRETGGVRKLRITLAGRGKRGGARVIYYYRGSRERVYLIAVYPKNVKISLTGTEKVEMRKLTAMLEAER
jgi:hypothetical protein